LDNARSFFKYANKRLKHRDGIGPLASGSELVTDPPKQASVFQHYFGSVFTTTPLALPRLQRDNQIESPPLVFSAALVECKLSSLKPKASITPDGLPPILFKRLAGVLSEPLSLLFTRSLAEGEVPTAFRLSVVTPVFKKGDRKKPSNYRPVSQGSVMCLVMEKLIVDYLNGFLRSTSRLDPNQHGFTRGRSTCTQLLGVIQDWGEARARGQKVHCIYFDFSRAFDKVDHDLLILKLTSLGVRDTVVKWCKAYLRDRQFAVKVGNSFSSSSPCPSGVPQGSAAGPLFWAIYVLDIKDYIPEGVTYKLYADDLKIYVNVDSVGRCDLLQTAIDGVARWSIENGMEISVPKCACLKVGRGDFVYTLNGEIIPEVRTVRDLGVLVSNDLKFREHVAQVSRSASVICNLALRSFIVNKPEFYIKIYNALIIPKLLYCSAIWSPSLACDIELLEKVRGRFVRLVSERCVTDRESIVIPSVMDIHREADLNAVKRIFSSGEQGHFFNIVNNNLRGGPSIRSKCVAPTNIVNNLFSWRVISQDRPFIA